MALAERAKLVAELSLDDKMSGPLKRIDSKLGAFSGAVNRNLGRAVDSAASFAARKLTDAFTGGIEALKQDAVVAAQTAAVIKSTGGAAGISSQQVSDLADKLSILDGVQDDVVQGAENLLLTFTNIGGDIFPDVTAAVLDMSAALGQDTKSSAIQLGKALNNPLVGLTALRRVGVAFTEDQVKQIKSLVKHNQLRKAQKIILGEVQREFTGVAKAQADADPSRRLQIATEKFQKSLATGLLPVVEKVQTRLTDWLSKPQTLETVKKIGDAIGGLFTDQNLDAVASAMETAANAIGKAITLFNSLPSEVKALAIGAFAINKVTGGAIGGLAGGLGKLLGAGLSTIRANNVTVVGGKVTGGGTGTSAGGGTSKLGKGLAVASAVVDVAAIIAAQQQISSESTAQAAALQAQLSEGIKVQTPAELQTSLAAVNQGIKSITDNPLLVYVRGDALASLQSMQADLQKQISLTSGGKEVPLPGGKTALQDVFKPGVDATNKNKDATVKSLSDLGGIERTGNSSLFGAIGTSASRIAAAVANARVVPNVTTTVTVNVTPAGVQKATNTQVHYGKPNGSAGGGNAHGGGGNIAG